MFVIVLEHLYIVTNDPQHKNMSKKQIKAVMQRNIEINNE